jgi:hypothetical protein
MEVPRRIADNVEIKTVSLVVRSLTYPVPNYVAYWTKMLPKTKKTYKKYMCLQGTLELASDPRYKMQQGDQKQNKLKKRGGNL